MAEHHPEREVSYVHFVRGPQLKEFPEVAAIKKQSFWRLLLRRLMGHSIHTACVVVRIPTAGLLRRRQKEEAAVREFCAKWFRRAGYARAGVRLKRVGDPGMYGGYWGALYTVRIHT